MNRGYLPSECTDHIDAASTCVSQMLGHTTEVLTGCQELQVSVRQCVGRCIVSDIRFVWNVGIPHESSC